MTWPLKNLLKRGKKGVPLDNKLTGPLEDLIKILESHLKTEENESIFIGKPANGRPIKNVVVPQKPLSALDRSLAESLGDFVKWNVYRITKDGEWIMMFECPALTVLEMMKKLDGVGLIHCKEVGSYSALQNERPSSLRYSISAHLSHPEVGSGFTITRSFQHHT